MAETLEVDANPNRWNIGSRCQPCSCLQIHRNAVWKMHKISLSGNFEKATVAQNKTLKYFLTTYEFFVMVMKITSITLVVSHEMTAYLSDFYTTL